nr:immunoglobulin light chain junction region [Macaca mulatta]MPO03034.1 immunoglobulin light chain junction region [Macaca mulatta]MPO03224.1 immunoglobulin light chain junction region [Macaca mulatta]MPO03426.1 immunoglobulin light chain junction region [Macaca mulatta]MPO03575.1 immunoglobulin light chain junction region [Macaca mulatta]
CAAWDDRLSGYIF